MMKHWILLLGFAFFSLSSTYAQSLEDAVRFSRLSNLATARTIASGGALGPMGVDFGAFGNNPAGLARLRYSEALISFGATYLNTKAGYAESNFTQNQDKVTPTINGFALSFANPGRRSKWLSRNFSIGLSRNASFNRELNLVDNTSGSITDRFLDLANGLQPVDLDPFEAGLAFDVLAIDTLPGTNDVYFSDLEGVPSVTKDIVVKNSGSINELQIAFGGNYNNKLLIGAGIGFSFIDYKSERTHFEEDVDASIDFFQDLTFQDKLESVGAGVNVKLGLIYMINNEIFISVAGQSPTWYLLTDTYETNLEYAFDEGFDNEVYFDEIAPNEFEYNFTSPWKLSGGVGTIINNNGFVSLEVEYLDYTQAKYDLTTNSSNTVNTADTDAVNADIENILQTAINIKLGGEYRFGDMRLRGGFQTTKSPFLDFDEGRTSISAGFGYRLNKFFVDLGAVYSIQDELYFPYTIPFDFNAYSQPVIENKLTNINLVLTLGTKF
ncbi:MAG: hypothetical protein KJP00_08285 [Bacteroidia bacterium]|nr:hypothetical protein [Bacteroidia bacterium]